MSIDYKAKKAQERMEKSIELDRKFTMVALPAFIVLIIALICAICD